MIKRFLYFIFFVSIISVLRSQETKSNSVRFLFLGDIMGHGPQIKAAYNTITKSYNYDSNFRFIQSILSDADVTIGNLEVTLGTQPYSGYPQFSSPPELAVAIQNAGIDLLGTANNHSCDRGKKGILKTIEVLDSLNIAHVGTYISTDEKEKQNPLIIEKNNLKIALLNYTYGTNGIPVPKGTIVNLLDKANISQDVARAKALQPDQIIAFVHWGQQYKNLPSAYQKTWFAYFKSLGINIVIGSHPHVVQPMKWNQKENTLVVYSLGNFISNQRPFPRDGGAIFELELKKENGKTSISKAQYQLIWVLKEKNTQQQYGYSDTEYTILPVDEFEYKSYFFKNKTDYHKMMRYAKHARDLFKNHNINIDENKAFTDGLVKLMQDLYFNL